MKKAKAHTIYKTKDGTRCPGVTTITGLLNKPFLVKWANNLGLKGIDSSKFVDEKASIGTLAHEMVLAHFKKEELNTSDYSKNQIEAAENSFDSFLNWESQHDLKPILVETPLVSEELRYGGTPDFYGDVDEVRTLLDLKTGRSVYQDYFYQLAGYRQLVEENGNEVKNCRILRIGTEEGEGFEEVQKDDLSLYYEVFYHLLRVYYLQKEIKK